MITMALLLVNSKTDFMVSKEKYLQWTLEHYSSKDSGRLRLFTKDIDLFFVHIVNFLIHIQIDEALVSLLVFSTCLQIR